MRAVRFGMAAALLCGTAWAQTATNPNGAANPNNSGTYYIAPGTPATVGRNGSVVGTAPGETVPAPHGSMSTFGGHFGTGSPRSASNNSSPAQPAVTTSDADRKTSAAPVSGSNSFTRREARRRIERGGFTEVSGLQKGGYGVWLGKAVRDGSAVGVFCDFQGNVGAL